jgi:hypothetical protein
MLFSESAILEFVTSVLLIGDLLGSRSGITECKFAQESKMH